MRYLGHRDVWENCYFSTYGREAALRYGEKSYCQCGEKFYTRNNLRVRPGDDVCDDWHLCKGLNEVMKAKKKKKKVI